MSEKSDTQPVVIVTANKDLVQSSTSTTLERAATLPAQEFKQLFSNSVSSLSGFSASTPKPSLPPAIAPPETGYTTDDWLAEADDLIKFHEGEGHETVFVNRDEYKTMKALRQIVASLRADAARLTAERDAARAQVWAEAISVVEGDIVNAEPIDVDPELVTNVHEGMITTQGGNSFPVSSVRHIWKPAAALREAQGRTE